MSLLAVQGLLRGMRPEHVEWTRVAQRPCTMEDSKGKQCSQKPYRGTWSHLAKSIDEVVEGGFSWRGGRSILLQHCT